MKALLEGLLPRLLPGLPFLCIPHEGKRDLEKSIPRKLRAWREPGVRFIVVRDNDGGDCQSLKRKFQEICTESGRPDTLVRIAVQELEAWYFGDPLAIAMAFGKEDLKTLKSKAKYRNPDTIYQPSKELAKLVPEFQKITGARQMAAHLSRTRNTSRSFQVTMDSIERIFQNGFMGTI